LFFIILHPCTNPPFSPIGDTLTLTFHHGHKIAQGLLPVPFHNLIQVFELTALKHPLIPKLNPLGNQTFNHGLVVSVGVVFFEGGGGRGGKVLVA